MDLEEFTRAGLVDIDLPDEVFRSLAGLSILQFIKEKMREEGWTPKKGLKLFVVLDEAWKIAKDDESDAVSIVREGRKYQFGLIVASQNPTDVSEAIFSNVGTTFIFRIKFERYLDYMQSTLGFSPFMRNEISKFGVGQAAINMAFQTASKFSETFIVEKVEGEEPMQEYFLDVEDVLTEEQRRMVDVAKTYSFEKNELKRRLRVFGLDDVRIEEMTSLFDKKNRHMDVVSFTILLERYGLARSNVTGFLKDIGIDDSTIISIFSKADFKKLGMEDKDITEVVLSE
ncbi:MAG: ATP-binding protein [Candidatus Micrarchaeia archaeon]